MKNCVIKQRESCFSGYIDDLSKKGLYLYFKDDRKHSMHDLETVNLMHVIVIEILLLSHDIISMGEDQDKTYLVHFE